MIYFKSSKIRSNKGFTLLELLVVVVIVSILFVIVVQRQDTFQERFKTDDKVYDLVIALRKAQAYSLGVREHNCNGTKAFGVSYGVNINITNADRFHSFVDVNKDGYYNEGGANACYTETTLFDTSIISAICGALSSGVKRCYPTNPLVTLRQISITFNRPDPKPILKFVTSNGVTELTTLEDLLGNPNPNAAAFIYFRYPNQTTEVEVKVDLTGQVSVKHCSATCPK